MRKLPAAPSADQWAIANETSFSKGKVGGGKRSYYIAMVKILIIRFSSIGDIVLTSPVIRCLKKQLPECEIHFLVKEKFRSLVESNPYISTVHVLNGKITKVLRQLNEAGFDYVVDLQNNFRSALIRMALARNDGVVKKMNAEKWCMVNLKIKFTPTHIVHRYLQTVRNLGIADDGLGLDFFIPPADEIRPTELPLTHLHGFIAIVPGAAHFTKKFPLAKWKKLISLLPYPIIAVGGKVDEADGNALQNEFPYKVFNACGKMNLQQSASLIRQAKLVITPDTGMMHIAAAFQKRIISIWGNTTPALGMAPYFSSEYSAIETDSARIENKELDCRPCSKIGYQQCPKKHFRCMNDLDEKIIANAVKGLNNNLPVIA